ncbi:NTP transferase domain-containing protein [Yersinia enterocolitica]|uniref:nucleotidyltransferase family protein n=1 Tax=Yersinia enterocolitica TaxID=630 RepID=UPI00155A3E21|nr:nucleotidyltransferase family protein [Yersinia enterocolitica]MBX9482616.1 nucleotidyltransferase family protein [Yersinia enterocolitica]NQS94642.1 NTP transferase domain-containing protein [Yersinia enterocolitica]NQT44852.1 NTP transferase domain-containing protein [Yersinia enterocolitica]NQT99341.1 NTP transferase domain-containing protein [Yersinia enterocolitica]HDL6874745.1 nucleotidyltransferase family protein [Yersinia enterocolitica]
MLKDWTRVLITPKETIRKALVIINNEALRIALITDSKKKLLGVVTDGDIRRGLLNNVSLDDSVELIMNCHPITANKKMPKSSLAALMQLKGILSVPLIDPDGYIEGLETLEYVLHPKKYENPVFIMAGGFGTRLRPLTDHCPKPMLKVGGRPILETILLNFVSAGFSNFYISTHFMSEQIKEYFGDGNQWNISITYVYEEIPLGTGGALGLLPSDIPNLPLIMINGDVLTTVDIEKLLEFHSANTAIATMCVRNFEYKIPFGVINSDGYRILSMEEKPTHRYLVNAGIYVISPELFLSVPKNKHIDMPTLLEDKISSGSEVVIFPIHEYWLDIGRIDDFNRAQNDIYGLGLL